MSDRGRPMTCAAKLATVGSCPILHLREGLHSIGAGGRPPIRARWQTVNGEKRPICDIHDLHERTLVDFANTPKRGLR